MRTNTGTDLRIAMVVGSIGSTLKEARSAVTSLLERMKSEVWELGDDLGPDHLDWLIERIQTGTSQAEKFVLEFVSKPLAKVLAGEVLTEPEYHAMRALGVLPDYATLSGITAESEYQVYRLLRYEDRGRGGIISTSVFEASRRASDGTPFEVTPVRPEQVSRQRLTPRQEAFIRATFPEDYKRMRP